MLGELGIGDITKIASALMRGDKGAIADLLKPQLPDLLTAAINIIILANGGNPATDGAFLWLHTRRDGSRTIMATVYRRTELDEPGEIIGSLDVLRTLESTDLAQYLK